MAVKISGGPSVCEQQARRHIILNLFVPVLDAVPLTLICKSVHCTGSKWQEGALVNREVKVVCHLIVEHDRKAPRAAG
jgi:hypothetical protein